VGVDAFQPTLGGASPATSYRRDLLNVGSPVGELPERSDG